MTQSAESDARREVLRERIADALFKSRALTAAMAFSVPRESWEDCRQDIAADVLRALDTRHTPPGQEDR